MWERRAFISLPLDPCQKIVELANLPEKWPIR
jgi:hypothetical protein